eukprot:6179418-Pleurochrysis_carterae.AAC.6
MSHDIVNKAALVALEEELLGADPGAGLRPLIQWPAAVGMRPIAESVSVTVRADKIVTVRASYV